MSIYVLGVTAGHNATAALSQDGTVIACVSEERFTRVKNQYGFPYQAVKFCLSFAKIRPQDLSYVVLASHITPPLKQGSSGLKEESPQDKRMSWFTLLSKCRGIGQYSKGLDKSLYRVFAPKIAKWTHKRRVRLISRVLGIVPSRIISAEHHLMHAYAGIFASGLTHLNPLLVITVDGEGDMLSSTVGVYAQGHYKRIASSFFSDSIGHFYSAITEMMGMKMLEHEYKVMGLAPYSSEGKSEEVAKKLSKFVRVEGLRIRTTVHSHRFKEVLKKELEGVRFDYVAGGAQLLTESLLLQLVRNAIRATGVHNVILSGGVFMNVKANQMIAELPEVKGLYIMPSCGDESLPIGCCYFGAVLASRGSMKLQPVDTLYLGPEYSNEEIERVLESSGFYYKDYGKSIRKKIAELLAKGEVVARCSGRMEFGARALGNRSILSDASDPKVVERINKMIKMRDFWMPFAPVIMEEHAKKYLKNADVLKKVKPFYMMVTFDSTSLAQRHLVGAMHPYDKTLRPQVVNEKINEEYYQILREFSKRTGRYGMLNTSFNIHGQPIVNSPQDALQTLRDSGLKYVALGTFLVSKQRRA